MFRVIVTTFVLGILTTTLVGCNRASPSSKPETPAPVVPPAGNPPPVPPPSVPLPKDPAPPKPPEGLTAKQVAGKTFIYNHQLLDGSLDGSSVVLAKDGKITGAAGEQTSWRVENGVLLFLDANDAVRTRFDKVYSGTAGLFFLGHRSTDNKYHTLLELPPIK